MEAKASVITSVRIPIEIVELIHLRNQDGSPVRVQCELVDETEVVARTRALPGDSIERLRMRKEEANGAPPPPEILKAREEFVQRVAPGLIEAGTALQGPDGQEVRPAFWFGGPAPASWPPDKAWPHPLSIPGRVLRLEDRLALVEAIMRQSGYGGGANSATFHAGKPGGRIGGLGDLRPGEAGRPDAMAGDPRPALGVEPDGDAS